MGEYTTSREAKGRGKETRGAETRKSDMLAFAAHELRGALAVLGARIGTALLKSRSVAYYEKTLRELQANLADVTSLLDAMLDVVRFTAPADVVRSASVLRLDEIAVEAVRDVSVQFEAENKRIRLEGEPVFVRGERVLLLRLVANLLDNARKFSSENACVCLHVGPLPDGHALLQVQDQGMGMTSEELARCTERFWRAGGARGSGHGLGLAFVKHVVDLHGGSLDIDSKPGEGTRVSVRLPVFAPEEGQ